MEVTTRSLVDAVAEGAARIQAMANACDAAAERLRAGDLSANAALRADLAVLDDLLGALVTQVVARAQAAQLGSGSDTAVRSLAALEQLARTVEAQERRTLYRAQAQQLLGEAQQLRYTRGTAPPGVQLHHQLQQFADAVADDSTGIAEAIAAGSHPLNALLTIVRDRELLDESTLDELMQRVTTEFGRSVGIAAALGRLVVPVGSSAAQLAAPVSDVVPDAPVSDVVPDAPVSDVVPDAPVSDALADASTVGPSEPPAVGGASRIPSTSKDGWIQNYRRAVQGGADQRRLRELRAGALRDWGALFDHALAGEWVVWYARALHKEPSQVQSLRDRAEQLHPGVRARLDAEDGMFAYREGIRLGKASATLDAIRTNTLNAGGPQFDDRLATAWVDAYAAAFAQGASTGALKALRNRAVATYPATAARIDALAVSLPAQRTTQIRALDGFRRCHTVAAVDAYAAQLRRDVQGMPPAKVEQAKQRRLAQLAGPQPSQVKARGDRRLPAVQEAANWTLYIDETGANFTPDADTFSYDEVPDADGQRERRVNSRDEGWIVLVAVPKGLAFPNGVAASDHGVTADPRTTDLAVQWVLDHQVGVLGYQAQGGVAHPGLRDEHDPWVQAVLETILIALRVLPLPAAPADCSVHVVVERRGPDEGAAVWQARQSLLQRELATDDPTRGGRLALALTVKRKGEDCGLAIADAVAYTYGASRSDAGDRRRAWGLDACFLDRTEVAVVRGVLDEFGGGRYPSAEAWARMLSRPDSIDARSIVGSQLARLSAQCRHDPGLFGRYLAAAHASLADKGYDVGLLVRQMQWLGASTPTGGQSRSLGAKEQLLLQIIALAAGNHQGAVAVAAAEQDLQDAARTLYAQDAHVSCFAELHMAVRLTNRYEFAAASALIDHWRAKPEATPGSLMYGRMLSSLGQHRAFTGQHAEARAFFDQALDVFARLSDPEARLNERRQTAVYRALASLDDATLTDNDRRQLVEAADVGLLPEQIQMLAATGDGESRWRHHLLVRYLAERHGDAEADPDVNAYLDAYDDWMDGPSHPWGLIAAWRGVLLLKTYSRPAAKWWFERGARLYSGPMAHGVSLLIRLAIQQATYCAGLNDQQLDPAEVGSLRKLLPAATGSINALARTARGDDPADVLRRVLPFNFR